MNLSAIQAKVEEIASYFEQNTPKPNYLGILSDHALGVALFFVYYDRVFKTNRFSDKVIEIIDECAELLNDPKIIHTYCGGMSGFGWFIQHLADLGFLNKEDIEELLLSIDDIAFSAGIEELKRNNHDFLHGGVGDALYLTDRTTENPNTVSMLGILIAELDKLKHTTENGCFWYDNAVMPEDVGKKIVNYSLSHGVASKIILLSRALSLGITPDKTEALLKETLHYVIHHRNEDRKNGFFPLSCRDGQNSLSGHLAWCYGDLGMGIALLKASEALKDEELQKTAIELLVDCSKRTLIKEQKRIDAGLCHGTLGIAQIFNFLSRKNPANKEEYEKAFQHWVTESMLRCSFEDGFLGFKEYDSTPQHNDIPSSSILLTGVSGIALSLLSALNPEESAWEKCLLID